MGKEMGFRRGWQFVALMTLAWTMVASAWADDVQIPEIPAQPAISVAGKNITKTIQFKTLRESLVEGTEVGKLKKGLFCSGSASIRFEKTYYDSIRKLIDRSVLKAIGDAGYSRYEGANSAFDTTEVHGADLWLGATIKDNRASICVSSGTQATGGVYYKFFWELYSVAQQKVIFSKTTEGSFNTDSSVAAPAEIHNKAITNAFNNLLADPGFAAAVSADTSSLPASAATNVPVGEMMTLNAVSPPVGGASKNIPALEKAVVTIMASNSQGSGFYIDKSGYLLTDYHVVKDSKFVKVIFHGTNEEIVGEVVRINAARDVALIKTAKIDFAPLSIRFTLGQPGEDVYAIGSPMGLTNTLSRGIVSALRKYHDMDYVQSDVGNTHGNSGGPLIDANGSVIGISDIGIAASNDNLNLFTPIGEALTALSVQIAGQGKVVPNASPVNTVTQDQRKPQANAASVATAKPQMKLGRSSVVVEQMAKDQGCSTDFGAALITDEGPSEIYKVNCTDGKTFVAKCEMRQCTAM